MFQYQNWVTKNVFGIKWYSFKPKQYQVVKKAAKRPVKAISKLKIIDNARNFVILISLFLALRLVMDIIPINN